MTTKEVSTRQRTPFQENMLYAVSSAVMGAACIGQVLNERKVESFQLLDGDNNVVFQADRDIQKMLNGGAAGAYNELVHPINKKGNRSTSRVLKAVAESAIKRIKNTNFDYELQPSE